MNQGNGQGAQAECPPSVRTYLARVLSDIANPLFLPPVVFFAVGWQALSSVELLWLSTSVSLLFYTLIPLGIVYHLLKKGHISSTDAPEHHTRSRLFGYSISSSATGSILLIVLLQAEHALLAKLALLYLINPLVGLLINLKWKMSIHAASLAMAVSITAYLSMMQSPFSFDMLFYLSLIMLLLLLPLIWARHHLKVHTLSELLGGTAIGLMLTLLEMGLIM